jgi:Cu/Ag efflux pump CusA
VIVGGLVTSTILNLFLLPPLYLLWGRNAMPVSDDDALPTTSVPAA